jgi:hypothetical protein
MPAIRVAYLALAVIGAVLPMRYFIAWFEANGYDLGGMIAAWNVNDATTGLVYDLTVAAAALAVWIVHETLRTRLWLNLVCVPVIFGIGVSCALPLYLYMRGRAGGAAQP